MIENLEKTKLRTRSSPGENLANLAKKKQLGRLRSDYADPEIYENGKRLKKILEKGSYQQKLWPAKLICPQYYTNF